MTISKERINEIVVEIVEGGFGARQNDWASHQDFALDVIRRVEAESYVTYGPRDDGDMDAFVMLPLVSEE